MSFASGRTHRDWPRIYLGVFFTTLATLILELALTRLFSVVFYYHFAFLAISIAMFGLGGGGLFSYSLSRMRGSFQSKAAALLLANAFVVPLALLLLVSVEAQPGVWTLATVFFVSAIPFFLAGAALSLIISETIEKVDRIYFHDLLGAAAGCVLLVPFLNSFGGPNTVIGAGVTYAVAASLWYSARRKTAMRAVGVGVALVLVCLMVVNGKTRWMDLKYAKGSELKNELFVKWNSLSRVAVRQQNPNSQPDIVIDGDAATGIPPYNFNNLSNDDREGLLRMGPGFVYNLRPAAKTLVIGAGGGWDMARALASGSKDVTGVEINPAIANTIMRERFPDLSKRIYFRPEIHIEVEDGRSFVRRNNDLFTVIQLTLVDTWASTAAGAFALSENNLYTTDAFEDYLRSLRADGLLSISRWGFETPRESLRLLTLARKALARLGKQDAAWHILVLRENSRLLTGWGALDTVIVSREPFDEAAVAQAESVAALRGLEVVYLPGRPGNTAFHRFLTTPDPQSFYATYPFDVSPVGDNRPFFFYTVQPRDLWGLVTGAGRGTADFNINRAVPTLVGLFVVSIVAMLFILLLPPLLLKSTLPREPALRLFLAYFVMIGMGYILTQVAAIQNFVLLLGHPTYSLTVIIFSMLVFSGLGSFFSRKLTGGQTSRLRGLALLISLEIAILALVATPLSTVAVAWPFPLKVLMTVLLVGIPAFTMGVPFPMGLQLLETWSPATVRWAWALNAAASVLGSVSAIVLAISFGLRETLLIGGLCYLLAGALLSLAPRSSNQSDPTESPSQPTPLSEALRPE
jgi:MFS family permease